MTDPSCRRQGHASTLVRHVFTRTAGRPTYLDAQTHAMGLYKGLGFGVVEGVRESELMTPMVRPADVVA